MAATGGEVEFGRLEQCNTIKYSAVQQVSAGPTYKADIHNTPVTVTVCSTQVGGSNVLHPGWLERGGVGGVEARGDLGEDEARRGRSS